ncbi:MAG: carboxypeptidase-like regulatory domain-containing protein [Chitinophagales bacterium]|nr:carboxypeptidase-like regulatory domain-containing protein [Chitinophagales bacterium]
MKKPSICILTLFFFLAYLTTRAQSDVIATIQVIPPYSPYLSTYVDQPNKLLLTLTNISRGPLRVKLWVRMSSDNGVSVTTAANFQPSRAIDLATGEVKNFDFSTPETRDYFDANHVDLTGLTKAQLIQNQALPEGNYSICVRVLDYNAPNTLRSMDACANIPVSYIDPPMAIQPACGNTVNGSTPQNIIFNWTPPATASGVINYEFTLKEVPNTLNPNDVIKNSAFPVLFNTTLTGANVLVYTNANPALEEGKKYVWRVKSIDPLNSVQFKNNGFSEACWFKYVKPVSVINTTSIDLTSQTGVIQTNPAIVAIISQRVIKGKLQWAFRKTEEGSAFTEMQATFSGSDLSNTTVADLAGGTEYNLSGLGGFGGSTSGSGSGSTESWATQGFSAVGGAGAGGMFFQGDALSFNQLGIGQGFQVEKPSLFTQTRDKILKLAGTNMHPLKKTQVKVLLTPTDEVVNLGGGLLDQQLGLGGYDPTYKSQSLGIAYTNSDGEFEIKFPNDIIPGFYDVAIEIDDPDFIYPTVKIPLSKIDDGVYSIGTLTGLARTFRLQVDIRDDNEKPVKGCSILATHDPNDWSYAPHPNLTYEGNRVGQGIDGNLGNVQVAALKNTTVIPRVFPRVYAGGYICLETSHEGYFSNKVGLNVSGTNGMFSDYLNRDETPVYKYTAHLWARDPEVRGKVLIKENNAPVKGVVVTVSRGSKSYSATTNDKGEFDIMDIDVDSKSYTLSVKPGNGIDAYSEEILLNTKPNIVERTIYVTGKMIPVVGRVVDEEKQPLDGAVVVWKTGGSPATTHASGNFLLYNITGKHTLVVKKPGFRDREVEVNVKEGGNGSGGSLATVIGDISAGNFNLSQQGAFNQLYGNVGLGGVGGGGNSGNTGAATGTGGFQANLGNFQSSWSNVTNALTSGSGVNSIGTLNGGALAEVNDVFGNVGAGLELGDLTLGNACDVGDIELKRFYLLVTVRDETKNILAGCRIEFNGDSVGKTDATGRALLRNVSPNTDNGLVVYGPEGSDFIAKANAIVVTASQDTALLDVYLKKGLVVSGSVSHGAGMVKDATVYVEGTDYIKATTNGIGMYKLAVPTGNLTLRAVKSGLIGDKKTQDFVSGTYTVNFSLKDAGFEASKLLGFPVQLTESTPAGTNEFSISGEFINIPSNSVFKAPAGMKIAFHAQKVKVTGGIPAPVSGEIVTDETSLSFNLWDYLHVKLSEPSGIKVKPNGNNSKGKIEGTLKVDLATTFPSISGFSFPSGQLSLSKTGAAGTLPVYTSDGTAPFSDGTVKLYAPSNSWSIYEFGLNVDYAGTYIDKDGITVAGEITTEGFKYLSGLKMKIDQMQITKTGSIDKLKVKMSPSPSVSMGSWTLAMDHLEIQPTGLKLGGEVKGAIAGYNFALPFTGLNLSKTNLTGGSFSLPSGGLNLLDFVKINPGLSSGLTFSSVAGTSKFQLGGNVKFGFEKYFNTGVKIDDFKLMSDGNVAAQITTAQSYSLFDIVTLKINNLGINTATKQIDLGGKVQFDLVSIGAGVGTNMHYKKSGVTFDDFDINVSAGGIGAIKGKVSFANGGFSCTDAHLKVASSPIDFKAAFHYNNTGLGAYFNMGPAVTVPIGPLSLDKIGGGFDYNKPQGKFTVYGDCRVKFTPDPYGAVELDPTNFSIAVSGGGPVLSASAAGKLVKIPVANASFVMDIPGRTATLDASAGGGINIIPGLSASANANIHTAIGFGSDPYLFFGQSMNINVSFLCNSAGGLAVGVNYPVSESEAATYKIPAGKFTGAGSWATASIGSTKESAKPIDVGIGSAKVWCGYSNTVNMWANLQGNSAGFGFGGTWGAGAEACVDIFGCFGLGASASGNVSGALSSSGIESASGTLAASAGANIGCCGGCGGTKICWACAWFACVPCGARVCVHPSVSVTYAKGSGFSVDY